MEALHRNFEGFEDIRHLLRDRSPKYGNDDDYADDIMKDVFTITGKP